MNTPEFRHLPVPLPENLHILHLGDSYTSSEGIDQGDGWPAVFASLLKKKGIPLQKQEIVAANGWSSRELLQAMQENPLPRDWHFLTLCIGVNDQYRRLDIAEFRQNLAELIRKAEDLLRSPRSALLLLSIPDWTVSPFALKKFPSESQELSREIDRFNQAVSETAEKFGIPFLDWTPISRRFGRNPAAYAEDGLHPSSLQQAIMAKWLVENTATGFFSGR